MNMQEQLSEEMNKRMKERDEYAQHLTTEGHLCVVPTENRPTLTWCGRTKKCIKIHISEERFDHYVEKLLGDTLNIQTKEEFERLWWEDPPKFYYHIRTERRKNGKKTDFFIDIEDYEKIVKEAWMFHEKRLLRKKRKKEKKNKEEVY